MLANMEATMDKHPRAGELLLGLVSLYWGAVVALWPGPARRIADRRCLAEARLTQPNPQP